MSDNGNIKEKISNEKFNLKEVIILILVTAVASMLTGFVITNRMLQDKNTKNDVKPSSALDTFISNYNYIINNYYGEVDENKVLNAALAGVLDALGDPYTAYIDKTAANNFNAQLEGSYRGLGIEIYNDNDSLRILSVFKDSPADKAGLKPGDTVIKLNGEDISKMTSSDFASKIQSSSAVKYKLVILRDGNELTLDIDIDTVVLKSTISKVFKQDNKNVGYLYISVFANNTYGQVKDELESLELQNIDSLIIDVRGNSGGHLTSVENILDLFLDSSHVIYKTEQNGVIDSVHSDGKATKEYPIVILTDQNSASASEILTAALKDEYGAKSIGKKTYGKGSAQELITLPNGSQYKFTTKKWLTPKGNSIDGVGIDVDLEVNLSEEYLKNPSEETDNQLQAAINLAGSSN